jgi:hypothetical protein
MASRIVRRACALLVALSLLVALDRAVGVVAQTSKVGTVRECVASSRTLRRLCGASGAVLKDNAYLYVAAARSNAVTVIDTTAPANMFVNGSVASFKQLRRPVDLELHDSGTYVVALAAGDPQTKNSSVVLVDAREPTRPAILTLGHECNAYEEGGAGQGGRTIFDGRLCGATAFTVEQNYAFVLCGETNRLTVLSLPNDASLAQAGSVQVVASIQSDEFQNGEAVVVANGKAYVRSEGVCSTCVAVVDVSDFTSNNGLVRLSMLALSEVSSITADVPKWRWSAAFLARGSHRANDAYPYDWVVNPVSSSVTSVTRACMSTVLQIGDSPAACAGRNEFAYDATAEANAYNFRLGSQTV